MSKDKDTKRDKKPIVLRGKKKLMITALTSQLGIVTSAAQQIGLGRNCHYRWMKEDPKYKQAVEEIPDLVLDFVENALLRKIKEGDASSIQFYLKHKARVRGYLDLKYIKAEVTTRNYNITIQEPKQIVEFIPNVKKKTDSKANKEV